MLGAGSLGIFALGESSAREPWFNRPKQDEIWSERSEDGQTWTERDEQSEVWTTI